MGYRLNTSGISGGTIVLLAMGVAADGALYAANMDTSSTTAALYRLYRWADSGPETVPVLVFSGEPAGLSDPVRWGDTMAVRGAGIGTEVLIDASAGTLAAVLRPSDGTMSAFTSTSFSQFYGPGSIGRSLEFGAGNTFWQKRKGTGLQLSGFDLAVPASTVRTNYDNFPSTLGPVGLDPTRSLLAGINFSGNTNSPDTLELYDVAEFNSPLLVDEFNFPLNEQPNANFIGQVVFAGHRVFAVNGNNGIIALTIVPPSGPPLHITRAGSTVVLSWSSSATDFVLQKTSTLSPPDWMNVSIPVIVTDGRNTVTENVSPGKAFYQLRKE